MSLRQPAVKSAMEDIARAMEILGAESLRRQNEPAEIPENDTIKVLQSMPVSRCSLFLIPFVPTDARPTTPQLHPA